MLELDTTLAGLRCHVVQDGPEGASPARLVVLCHGYGAPGHDLVGLSAETARLSRGAGGPTRFLFPHAPDALEEFPGGQARAWWAINFERLQAAQSGDVATLERLREDVPEKLPKARRALMALIDEALRQTKLPTSKLILGGFSQGAMLATDVALRLDEAPAGLAVLSGTVINESDWRKRAPQRAGLRVLQSHGRYDPILPFREAERLRQLLTEAGLKVEWVPFDDVHTITGEVVRHLANFIEAT